MSYMLIGDRVHKNPPTNGCNASSGKIISSIPEGKDKCDRCFGLPR